MKSIEYRAGRRRVEARCGPTSCYNCRGCFTTMTETNSHAPDQRLARRTARLVGRRARGRSSAAALIRAWTRSHSFFHGARSPWTSPVRY
ncbi:MAG: hypothetical protein MZV64_62325 [Ignavibacteriales bacterium]|nr:hypothetical protein [Ignavibacteriales bacterium]